MNPGALILIALLANNNSKSPAISSLSLPKSLSNSFNFDNILGQLQTTVQTMEKLQELSRIGSAASNFSLPSPSRTITPVQPVTAEVVEPTPEPVSQTASMPDLSSLLQNVDLQSAMQTIGPLLSMLNPK